MNKQELGEVVGHLEALDSLATLFSRLWFDKVKAEVENDKTRAYLMVFDDAFPGLNQVIGFVKRSAQAMALGDADKVRDQFEVLSQQLLQREIESEVDDEVDESIFEEEEEDPGQGVSVEELSEEERDALESVEQEDLDRLFASPKGGTRPAKPEPDIDSLFARQGVEAKAPKASPEEIEEFLAAETEGQDEGTEVAEETEEEVSLDELLAGEETTEEEAVEEEELEEVAEEEEDDLGEETEEEAEELDLAELLGEEEEEEEKVEEAEEDEGEVDLAALLAEEEEETDEEESDLTGPEISEDEMAALLADTDEEEEEKPAPPPPKKKAAPPPPPPPPPKKVAKRKARDEDEQGNGDQTLSNDEIDALLG